LIILNAGVFSQNRGEKFTFQSSLFLFLYDLLSLGVGNNLSDAFADLESQYKINDIFNISFTFSCSLSFLTGGETYFNSDHTAPKIFQAILKPMFVYRPFKTGLKGFYIGIYQNTGWQYQ
jgi:hypothetical protein